MNIYGNSVFNCCKSVAFKSIMRRNCRKIIIQCSIPFSISELNFPTDIFQRGEFLIEISVRGMLASAPAVVSVIVMRELAVAM